MATQTVYVQQFYSDENTRETYRNFFGIGNYSGEFIYKKDVKYTATATNPTNPTKTFTFVHASDAKIEVEGLPEKYVVKSWKYTTLPCTGDNCYAVKLNNEIQCYLTIDLQEENEDNYTGGTQLYYLLSKYQKY